MSGRTTERILNAAAKGLLFLFLYDARPVLDWRRMRL